MEDPNHRRSPGTSEGEPLALGASIARRREILRRVGRASAAAGLASPLTAFAWSSGATGTPWCYKDKVSTTCVHATISGSGSVLLSAQANGKQNWGKACKYYNNYNSYTGKCDTSRVPSVCRDTPFKNIFSCSGSDSLGQGMGSQWRPNQNCLFNKTVGQILCSTNATINNSFEAHWAAAYCNSVQYYSQDSFPYTPTEVCSHYANVGGIRDAAYSFYTNCMEGIST